MSRLGAPLQRKSVVDVFEKFINTSLTVINIGRRAMVFLSLAVDNIVDVAFSAGNRTLGEITRG